MTLHETKEAEEQVILVSVSLHDGSESEASLDELEELVQTAGANTVGRMIQSREQIHPSTYIGKGKLEELKEQIVLEKATGIVCDDELSPVQLRNLQAELDIKVMDRTLVILDIFARRAVTNEGKIQVELAQLKYRLARLVGLRSSLSRLGGGIGTRGPGEKKLEMDRRLVKDRIAFLNTQLSQVIRHREVARSKRSRNMVPVAAIVGYTNAGKSTLLNTLTDASVLEEDMLFATLDPTTRILELTGKQTILLTDTVGFINKLPHHLIEAFKSTLEEARYADYIIHVADASNPQMEKQMYTVYETLDKLGVKDKPIVTLFNKIDKTDQGQTLRDFRADRMLKVSAKYGTGLEEFKLLLEELLREKKLCFESVLPYQEAGKLQWIRKQGELLEEEYQENGIYVKAFVPKELYAKLVQDSDES